MDASEEMKGSAENGVGLEKSSLAASLRALMKDSGMKKKRDYPRGAEWRQWDFHIHTPASFQWSGQRFSDMTEKEKKDSLDGMIKAMNDAEPQVFVLMDYWTFDGWLALKKRLTEADAPQLTKTVFPGIELRLVDQSGVQRAFEVSQNFDKVM